MGLTVSQNDKTVHVRPRGSRFIGNAITIVQVPVRNRHCARDRGRTEVGVLGYVKRGKRASYTKLTCLNSSYSARLREFNFGGA